MRADGRVVGRAVVESPQPREARFLAAELFEHVLAKLRFSPRSLPDSDFIHLPAEIGVRRKCQFEIGPSQIVALLQASRGKRRRASIGRHEDAIDE